MQKFPLAQIRNAMLNAQHLLHPPKVMATKELILNTIKNMGHLQIDTINVVARSQYVVLWARLGHYKTNWLDELLEEKRIFEYWSHAMCFLPIENYPLYRRLALEKKGHWGSRTEKWFDDHITTAKHVLNHIKTHGQTKTSDFKKSRTQTPGKSGWWNWHTEKIALEVLFDKGELMIAKRQNFHRVYDLRERILPDWQDTQAPNYNQVLKLLTIKALESLGIATSDWIADYFYLSKREIPSVLNNLLNDGIIQKIISTDNQVFYAMKNLVNFETLAPTHTTLLSPFDPLINNRKRASLIFNFDYQIECYTPAEKRRYGYFTLPILHRGQLIGRLDPKAHRLKKIFEIKTIYLEPHVKITDQMLIDVARTIKEFANWHQTPEIIIQKSNPAHLKNLLEKNL